jgi:hypothetical protein
MESCVGVFGTCAVSEAKSPSPVPVSILKDKESTASVPAPHQATRRGRNSWLVGCLTYTWLGLAFSDFEGEGH